MNLVFVNPHFGPVLGGIQKDMLCLAREMIALGDRVTFVTTYDEFPEGRVDLSRPLTYDLPPGLEIVRLEGHCRTRLRNFHPANPPLFLPGLTEAVLRCDPDGVIFFNIGWPLTVLPAILRLRRRAIVLYQSAYHGYLQPRRLDPWRSRLQLRVAALCHRIVPHSRYEEVQIVRDGGVAPEKITVAYPGVEALSLSPDQVRDFRRRHNLEGRFVVSHVARLSAFKGTDRLLRVLSEVRRRTGRDVVLLLVGRNLEAQQLAQLAGEMGVSDHVRATGPVSEQDLHRAYAASDIFALPSDYESFGFVFLEAMAHGVPVVGVNTGGVPEVIKHGETGFILDRADDEAGLADALVALATDDATSAWMSESARQWAATRFSWAESAGAMRRLINERPGARVARREAVA